MLPGHEGHDAEVHVATGEKGQWRYSCSGLDRTLDLAEVRAAQAMGGVLPMKGALPARWRERLEYDAELREPRAVEVPMLDRPPQNARRLAEGMALFVGLREAREDPDDETRFLDAPFVFALRFAMAYCGMSRDAVLAGRLWLEQNGVIERAGTTKGRAILWRFADVTPHLRLVADASEDADEDSTEPILGLVA